MAALDSVVVSIVRVFRTFRGFPFFKAGMCYRERSGEA